ncbi:MULTISPECIES: PaaI family thioesterase [Pseudomonadati]|uniref:PaaI family thioesterase n=1 Tax=Shewanella aestuarii TaxID=1028752 RepID=A0ABT0KXE9_9GAMM|nr:PaaI family thioesterase [Shewanella aestuarii]MCL1116138.1 PaaI family thioesterase [Shewanella aestuarii]GGN70620.1 phenylacetic acid degradation protein [Shewanella aestuarii]
MNLREMTGLQIMQAMLDGHIPAPSITQTMPMKAIKVSEGEITFEAQADERHLNPMGGVHGGFAATVLDSATACAVHSALPAGASYATIDLNVKMVRPVPKNQAVFATGKLINLSTSLAIADATLTDKQGRLLATACASCMVSR